MLGMSDSPRLKEGTAISWSIAERDVVEMSLTVTCHNNNASVELGRVLTGT